MTYKHGVGISEIPASIVPPARTSAGLPVVFGTAPVNLTSDPAPANKPVLCYSYKEAVEAFGYSADWESYTLCEFIYSHFALFNVAPVVLVNVLDETVHKTEVLSEAVAITAGEGKLKELGVMLGTVVLKNETTPYAKDTDYTLAFDEDGYVVVSAVEGGGITENTVTATYTKLDPTAITASDIIGGIDVDTGAKEGLELINEVFPRYRLVPGQVLAPGWSHDATVAAVMKAKASNINGHFKAISLEDVPTDTIKKYSDVAAWKNNNNYTSTYETVCWPKVKMGEGHFHFSTQLAGVICQTDSENEDIPYMSPSNKSLQANGAILADGTEVILGPEEAAYLNGQGIVTALNFIGGWKVWGNRTGCYPAVTDPKDAFIPIRRMFNWIGNTLTLTFWSKIDNPANRRLIDTVVDSANIWLNGLAARGFIMGGRVEFLQDENPITDLMDGILRFHVYATPPSPAREIDFIIEYDPQYLAGLFAA
ncbi:MAG: phage tail sheath family protein [Syntrophomonadaceae bacterium]|jgi:phage tail sheath protein FI